MTRHATPTLHCDGEDYDGYCTEWSIDYYDATAAYVGGTRITSVERAPGWRCTDTADYCPGHA